MKRSPYLNGRRGPRRRRALVLLPALFLLATPRPAPPPLPPGGPGISVVHAALLPFARDGRAAGRAGALLFRRAWHLTSPDPRFGGLSSLRVEGGRVHAPSDSGILFAFDLPRRPGPHRLLVRPLAGGGADKSSRDSEGLWLEPGRAWLSFEGSQSIERYSRAGGPDGGWAKESEARPAPMRRWPTNQGAEAIARLGDGRFILFGEGGGATSPLLVFDGDPADPATPVRVRRYRRPAGFRVTDAAPLGGTRLLLLHRRIDWRLRPSASLAVVDLGREGRDPVEGREIARIGSPLTVDNMEGVDVAREGGRLVVRMISDDNYMGMQRTLLLEYLLDPDLGDPAADQEPAAG